MSENREIPIACRGNNFGYTNPQTWQSLVISLIASGKYEGKDALRQADRLCLLMHARILNKCNLGFISPEDGLCEGTLSEAFEAYDQAAKRHNEEKVLAKKHAADLEAAKAAALAAVPAAEEVTNEPNSNAEPAAQPVTPT